MKRFNMALFIAGILFGVPSVADQSVIEPQKQGEVTFVSGGVGDDELKAMQAMRADYNLSLLFSEQGSGAYVSDVKVQIKNSKGSTVLETVSGGPKLFAKLTPGRYMINVDRDGHVIQKSVTIGDKRSTSLSFTWPRQKGD